MKHRQHITLYGSVSRWTDISGGVGGEASSCAGASVGAHTGSGEGASADMGAGSVIGDGAEGESVKIGEACALVVQAAQAGP